MINETITTQTKRFHHVKLIIRYIKRLFENKKGIIKILVHSSVIDINQMDVIFFQMHR